MLRHLNLVKFNCLFLGYVKQDPTSQPPAAIDFGQLFQSGSLTAVRTYSFFNNGANTCYRRIRTHTNIIRHSNTHTHTHTHTHTVITQLQKHSYTHKHAQVRKR